MFAPFGQQKPVLICAHRGHQAQAPENTLAAVAAAKRLGAHVCEIDVRLTADDVPVILHDARLERTTNLTGLLRSKTLAEIRQADAGSWFSADFGGEKLPTFAEMLEFCRAQEMALMIELKDYDHPYGHIEGIVAKALRDAGMVDNVMVTSFDHVAMLHVRKALPEVRTLGITHARHADIVGVARAAQLNFISTELRMFAPEDAEALAGAGVGLFCSVPVFRDEIDRAAAMPRLQRLQGAIRAGHVAIVLGDDVRSLTAFVDSLPEAAA